jgi:hypothetical protein
MNFKAKFAVDILKQYAIEGGTMPRGTNDISPLEEWLLLKLFDVVIIGEKEKKQLLKTINYVTIVGCDEASGFTQMCKESDIIMVGKEIYKKHTGDKGYYNFNKFLWVEFPDGREECRLDDIVPYEEND